MGASSPPVDLESHHVARGSHDHSGGVVTRVRSVPAHAGEPGRASTRRAARTVYPRARGGAKRAAFRACHAQGLSPRTRGSRPLARRHLRPGGSIPAHAGEPCAATRTDSSTGVYPRARGGATVSVNTCVTLKGLSPRTRGSQLRVQRLEGRCGSIPAHAGEPCRPGRRSSSRGVYPRARGGAPDRDRGRFAALGLSPRTRGSHALEAWFDTFWRSIPAHAGEPRQGSPVARRSKVYPRARGGAVRSLSALSSVSGLSPRTRGSRGFRASRHGKLRSIPAHAGEPCAGLHVPVSRGVYPRARGGASGALDDALLHLRTRRGLSPRTRGSLNRRLAVILVPWSIPAHAGEPDEIDGERRTQRVYPRARGGAGVRIVPGRMEVYPRARGGASGLGLRSCGPYGLSPRTRGSQLLHRGLRDREGSIPAHAGEPVGIVFSILMWMVYPRARGGAIYNNAPPTQGNGLSPRTRGSQNHARRTRKSGSIPAHAGEPGEGPWPVFVIAVYPRARGGATCGVAMNHQIQGLSPRTRGSHGWIMAENNGTGSIPAHAGEPSLLLPLAHFLWVYPRARGGA